MSLDHHARAGDPYAVGEFLFEPATGELTGPAGGTRLRRQAARCLELLARSAGELVAREDLHRDIWGDTHVDYGQSLNTCIKEVRIALGDSAGTPRYVETLPRRGYRLIAPVARRPRAAVGPSGSPAASRVPSSRRLRAAAVLLGLLGMAGLSASGPAPLAGVAPRPPRGDAEVERLLARGRHLLRTRDPRALESSLTLLQAAAEREPRDARVWATLAYLHRVLMERRPGEAQQHAGDARAAAARAVELDPELGAAHAARAAVLDDEGRLAEAEAAFRRAVSLDPEEPTARQWFTDLLRRQGRLDEAYVHARAARDLDPLSPGACTALAYIHLLRGDLGPARRVFEEALTLEPDFLGAQIGLARTHMAAREWDAALAVLDSARMPAELSRVERAYVLARSGRSGEARSVLREMEAARQGPYDIAVIHASLGEQQQAFEWLESALAARARPLKALPIDPRFEGMRAQPRFQALLGQVARTYGAALVAQARPGA